MTVRKSVVAAALASALSVTVLSACGGEDGLASKSADEIKDQTVDAMRAAKSMTLDFTRTADGQEMAMKLSLTKSGECKGTVTTDGANAEILRVDGTSYMKPDSKFWELNAGSPEQAQLIEAAVRGRWVEMSGGEDDFASFCDLDTVLKDMDEKDDKPEKGDEGEVNGTPTIGLVEKEDGETTTAHVATEGEPYILKMDIEGGDEPGTAEFSEFDEKVAVEAPSDSVSLDELGG